MQQAALQARLREERQRLGLSQQACADHVSASLSAWKRWEVDLAIPADQLAELSHLGFDVAYVLTGERTVRAGLTESEKVVVNVLRDMDEFARGGLYMVFERLAATPQVQTTRRSKGRRSE